MAHIDEWKRFGRVGIFLGEETFTPVRFLHEKGTGKIVWKYMRPFSGERVLENVPRTVIGSEYTLYTNDRNVGTKVQLFYMDINGNPTYTHLPPAMIRVNEELKAQNDYFKAMVSDMRKQLFDRSNKDRLMKEAIRLGGFRKEFIEAGTTGAEQFGYGRYGLGYSGLGLPSRTI